MNWSGSQGVKVGAVSSSDPLWEFGLSVLSLWVLGSGDKVFPSGNSLRIY